MSILYPSPAVLQRCGAKWCGGCLGGIQRTHSTWSPPWSASPLQSFSHPKLRHPLPQCSSQTPVGRIWDMGSTSMQTEHSVLKCLWWCHEHLEDVCSTLDMSHFVPSAAVLWKRQRWRTEREGNEQRCPNKIHQACRNLVQSGPIVSHAKENLFFDTHDVLVQTCADKGNWLDRACSQLRALHLGCPHYWAEMMCCSSYTSLNHVQGSRPTAVWTLIWYILIWFDMYCIDMYWYVSIMYWFSQRPNGEQISGKRHCPPPNRSLGSGAWASSAVRLVTVISEAVRKRLIDDSFGMVTSFRSSISSTFQLAGSIIESYWIISYIKVLYKA